MSYQEQLLHELAELYTYGEHQIFPQFKSEFDRLIFESGIFDADSLNKMKVVQNFNEFDEDSKRVILNEISKALNSLSTDI